MFNRAQQKLYPKWWSFHSEKWLESQQYDELDMATVSVEIEQRLDRFLHEQLPKMDAIVKELNNAAPRD